MVNIFPTRSNRNCLLVSSDRQDRTEAHREIARWAAERDLALPRRPRLLALVEDDTIVAEWTVIEHSNRTRVPGGRAA